MKRRPTGLVPVTPGDLILAVVMNAKGQTEIISADVVPENKTAVIDRVFGVDVIPSRNIVSDYQTSIFYCLLTALTLAMCLVLILVTKRVVVRRMQNI